MHITLVIVCTQHLLVTVCAQVHTSVHTCTGTCCTRVQPHAGISVCSHVSNGACTGACGICTLHWACRVWLLPSLPVSRAISVHRSCVRSRHRQTTPAQGQGEVEWLDQPAPLHRGEGKEETPHGRASPSSNEPRQRRHLPPFLRERVGRHALLALGGLPAATEDLRGCLHTHSSRNSTDQLSAPPSAISAR